MQVTRGQCSPSLACRLLCADLNIMFLTQLTLQHSWDSRACIIALLLRCFALLRVGVLSFGVIAVPSREIISHAILFCWMLWHDASPHAASVWPALCGACGVVCLQPLLVAVRRSSVPCVCLVLAALATFLVAVVVIVFVVLLVMVVVMLVIAVTLTCGVIGSYGVDSE